MTAQTIVQLLQSTKARDRNDGLDSIDQCLPGLFSRDIKEVITVSKALLSLIHYEKLQKDKSGTALKRLERGSGLLRNTIEIALQKLPPRPTGYISILGTMILQMDHLVFNDFIKTMKVIIQQQYIRDHFNLGVWESCIQMCMGYLRDVEGGRERDVGGKDREKMFRFTESLDTLNLLINSNTSNLLIIDMVSLDDLGSSFMKFLEAKEDNVLIHTNMLKVINRLMVSVSCEKYSGLQQFVGVGFRILVATKFNYHHNISLNDEICVFLNLDLVYHLSSRIDETVTSSLLSDLQSFLVHELNQLSSIGSVLSPQSVGLTQNSDPSHWFKLNTIYLMNNDTSGWFFLLGLARGLKKYYELRARKRDTVSSSMLEDSSTSFKRRKHDGIADALVSSTHEWELLDRLITTESSSKCKTVGIQLLLFMSESNLLQIDPNRAVHTEENDFDDTMIEDLDWNTSIFAKDTTGSSSLSKGMGDACRSDSPGAFNESIISILLATSNYRSLTFWSLLALNSLLYNVTRSDYSFASRQIKDIVKIVLPCVKSEQTSQLACHLLYHLVELILVKNLDLHDEKDPSLINQVLNVFELANYLGPTHLNNASFRFWLSLFKLMKLLGLNVNNFQSVLANWFMTKWSQVFDIESDQFCRDFECFSSFVYWMSKNQIKDVYVPDLMAYKGDFVALYFIQKRKQLTVNTQTHTHKTSSNPIRVNFTDSFNMDFSFDKIVRRFFSLSTTLARNTKNRKAFYLFKIMALDLPIFENDHQLVLSLENPDLSFSDQMDIMSLLKSMNRGDLYLNLFTPESILSLSHTTNKKNTEIDFFNQSQSSNLSFPSLIIIDHCIDQVSRDLNIIEVIEYALSKDEQMIMEEIDEWLEMLDVNELIYLLYKISSRSAPLTTASYNFITSALLLFGKRVLNDVYYERNEVTFVILCRLTGRLFGIGDKKSMFNDFFKWLLMAANKRLILAETSYSEYLILLLKILYHSGNKKSKVYGSFDFSEPSKSFSECFKYASVDIRIGCTNEISKYFSSVQVFSKQIAVYKELVNSFDPPVEYYAAAGYCAFLGSLTVESLDVTKSILFNLFEIAWSDTEYIDMVSKSLDLMCHKRIAKKRVDKMVDSKLLLNVIKIPLFKAWYSHHSFEKFPFQLFDEKYSSIEEFFVDNGKELLSVIVSSKSKNITGDFKQISKHAGETLLKSFYVTAYPLAFVSGGIKDDILKVINHLTGQSLKHFDKHLVILETLKLLDTSRMDHLNHITKQKLELKPIVAPLQDVIPLNIGCELIQTLIGTQTDFWDTKKIHFFSRQLMIDLNTCLTDHQTLVCLRRVMVVIGFSKMGCTSGCIFHYETLFHLIEQLLPLGRNKLFKKDVFVLFSMFELEKYPKETTKEGTTEEGAKETNESYEKLLLLVLSVIVDNADENAAQNLENYAGILDHLRTVESGFKDVFSYLRNLSISQVSNGAFDCTRFLKYKVRDSYTHGVKICSFLSHFDCLTNTSSETFLRAVLASPLDGMSDKFKLLCAKEIGQQKSIPNNTNESESDGIYEFDDIKKIDYLEEIVRLLFKFQHHPTGNIACMADITIGVLLGLDRVIIDTVCPKKNKYILPLQEGALASLFDSFKSMPDVKNNVKSSAESTDVSEASQWVTNQYTSLVDKLNQSRHRYIFVIKQFSSLTTDFAVESFPLLIGYYLNYGSSTGPSTVFKLISSFLENVKLHCRNSCEMIIKTILFIRQEAKANKVNKVNFENVYNALDLEKICSMAAKFRFYKTGLMLFEDFYCANKNDAAKFDSLSKWYERDYMQTIFECIDYEDLVHGLPRETSIENALKSVWDYNEAGASGRMKFELGSYESSRMLKVKKGSSSLVETMLSDGLNGTSKIIGESVAFDTKATSHSYEWSWKLNDWNLPVPETPQSTHEYIYKALKTIKDEPPYLEGLTEVERSLSRVAIEIIDTKGNRGSVSDTFISNLAVVDGITKVYKGINSQIDTETDFERIDNLMLSRIMAFNVLLLKQKTKTSNLIKDLARYNNLCLRNHKVQNSINTIMLMNDLCHSYEVEQETRSIVKYHSAKGLWEQKYHNGAISMMIQLKNNLTGEEPKVLDQDFEGEGQASKGKRPLDQDFEGINLPMVDSTLVEWLSTSRQELPTVIMEQYFSGVTNNEANCSPRLISETHNKLGKFCEEQYRNGDVNSQLNRISKQIHSKKKELEKLKDHYSRQAVPSQEKRTVQKYYSNLKQQMASESVDQQSLKDTKKTFLIKCLKCYMMSIKQVNNFEIVDKFFSLWFEGSNIEEVNDLIKAKFSDEFNNSPKKFVSWISQLVSRLSDEPDTNTFQHLVQGLITSVCVRYPYYSLYHLISLKEHMNQMGTDTNNEIMFSRIRAANKVYDRVKSAKLEQPRGFGSSSSDGRLDVIVQTISQFCNESISLSKYQLSKSKKLDLRNTSKLNSNYWLNLPDMPPPTLSLDLVPMDQLHTVPKFESIDPLVQVASSGISLPKIAKIRLTDGREIKVLFKSGVDDLRQDSVMEQVFEKVNKIFNNDKRSCRRNFRIRTYKIVPLGPNSGIIEFVSNSTALIDIIKPYHDKYDKIDISKAREIMRSCQNENRTTRIKIFKSQILTKISPVLHHFFFDNYLTPQKWSQNKVSYSRGLAISSIVGHILGLGDRHCNNILIDKHSGEPIHIDLGVAFDQGTRLQIPETIPFRLTRDLVDGLGITGVEGIFRNSCEVTFEILRENQDHVISILNIFKWDPLYKWTISPLRKRKLQDADHEFVDEEENDISEGGRAIMTVKDKLQANGLSTETTVRELISNATNVDNLALLFSGWSPFF